ncbi:bcl-2/adenovirus E1B 19 kDa-interacting protein 2-like protein isoform X2 [Nothobranchius furzeri]|uniref:Transcript variant X2 n=1 Tax=Nothobranchius furzeri TaxID=105023 RepID=A0A9D3BKH1_NOTFU|nr:bcl-2/adenovirus E1B 19 kDa-interacting protein 2-like protein isoform X2 [Nothobranchius furzeri]KAF7210790.1 transcript variant X2 [Nothobranchius furzeri]
MEARKEKQEETTSKTFLVDHNDDQSRTTSRMTSTITENNAEASGNTSTTNTSLSASHEDQPEDKEARGHNVALAMTDGDPAVRDDQQVFEFHPGTEESESENKSLSLSNSRPAPPSCLALSGPRPMKKKVLTAPELSLSLGGSMSMASDDFPSGLLSPSPEDADADDAGLDIDLDAIETPSDSESLHFPIYDLDLEDDLQRLGVASHHHRRTGSRSRSRSGSQSGSLPGTDQSGLGAMDREDVVDAEGTRWRCFSTGDPPQESRVNMSVLEPFLRVLSHGGYYGDGMNDIIVFSSCYLPENTLENYQYVMDNLFRFIVGTLELMVAENYVIVYLCAGGQKEKLPRISWLKECYTTIDRRLRKNLKSFYVVHPTWYIKVVITIIKPFISTKFSRKLQFVNGLQQLSHFIPTEHVQIPDCVKVYDQNLSR